MTIWIGEHARLLKLEFIQSQYSLERLKHDDQSQIPFLEPPIHRKTATSHETLLFSKSINRVFKHEITI